MFEANYGISDFAHGFDFYILTNPGTDLTFNADYDVDGVLQDNFETKHHFDCRRVWVTPKLNVSTYAVELTFQRALAGQLDVARFLHLVSQLW